MMAICCFRWEKKLKLHITDLLFFLKVYGGMAGEQDFNTKRALPLVQWMF